MRSSRTASVTAATRRSLISGLAVRQTLFRRNDVLRRHHAQRVDTPAVGTGYPKLEAVDGCGVTSPRQAAKLFHEQTGDGIEAFLFREVRTEIFIELVDARDTAHRELPLRLLTDVVIVLDIELIVDLADNLLDHVLDGDQPGDAAVLIDDQRHVIAVAAEFLQQHVEPL